MTENLQDLLEAAKNVVLTPEGKEQQRRSFAYGNTVIENPRITREMTDRAAEALGSPTQGMLGLTASHKSNLKRYPGLIRPSTLSCGARFRLALDHLL